MTFKFLLSFLYYILGNKYTLDLLFISILYFYIMIHTIDINRVILYNCLLIILI